jgi:thiol:disulfide interchange protein DsbD
VVLGLMAFVAKLGSPIMGFGLFFALALGIGTPLFVLAAFSAKLPVPGMWMVAVKKAAGFLLLGAAAYFVTPILPEIVARYAVPVILMAGGLYLGFFEKSIRASRIGSNLGRVSGTAALIVAVMLATPHMKTQSIKWQPYTPSAVTAGKPIMIDFTAKWCMACQDLERGPFSDARVIRAADRFKHLRVDGTDRNNQTMLKAAQRFGVRGFPTVIFINSSGKEVTSARIAGFVDTNEMLKRIKSVK